MNIRYISNDGDMKINEFSSRLKFLLCISKQVGYKNGDMKINEYSSRLKFLLCISKQVGYKNLRELLLTQTHSFIPTSKIQVNFLNNLTALYNHIFHNYDLHIGIHTGKSLL